MIFSFLLTWPGVPFIYYGDEIGLEGGKDPDCRGAFPWDPGEWDHAHLEFVRKLIDIRTRFVQLRRGDFQRVVENDSSGVVAFSRQLDDQAALIVVNAGKSESRLSLEAMHLPFPDSMDLYDVLNGQEISRFESHVEIVLKPLRGAIIVAREQVQSL